MPLNEDAFISREKDGSYNEDYCKWCYAEGKFVYQSRESLLDYLVEHMPNPDNLGVDDRRAQFNIYLSQLKHWMVLCRGEVCISVKRVFIGLSCGTYAES